MEHLHRQPPRLRRMFLFFSFRRNGREKKTKKKERVLTRSEWDVIEDGKIGQKKTKQKNKKRKEGVAHPLRSDDGKKKKLGTNSVRKVVFVEKMQSKLKNKLLP